MWTAHPNHPDAKVRYFEQDGKLHRQVQQNVDAALDMNRRVSNETGGWTPNRTMRKAASIPATLYYDWIVEWQRKGLLPDMTHPEFERKCNELCLRRVRSGDYSGFSV